MVIYEFTASDENFDEAVGMAISSCTFYARLLLRANGYQFEIECVSGVDELLSKVMTKLNTNALAVKHGNHLTIIHSVVVLYKAVFSYWHRVWRKLESFHHKYSNNVKCAIYGESAIKKVSNLLAILEEDMETAANLEAQKIIRCLPLPVKHSNPMYSPRDLLHYTVQRSCFFFS